MIDIPTILGAITGSLLGYWWDKSRKAPPLYHPCKCREEIYGHGPLRESDQKEVCWSCYTVDKYKNTLR